MIQLRMYVKLRDKGTLTTGLDKTVAKFNEEIASARRAAAETATARSRFAVKRTRPRPDPRPGRHYEPIEQTLQWKSGLQGDQDLVRLDTKSLDEKSRHWIIQNIGTGRSGVLHSAGKPNPLGRPTKEARYVKTIKSQVGRRVRAGLVFADQAGNFVAPGAGHGQQLYERSKVKGVPSTPTRSQPGIIIRKEIKPQRFVQVGARAGFRQYRESVLSAARTAFDKPR